MRRFLFFFFAAILILNSCKFRDASESPSEPDDSDVTFKLVTPNGGDSIEVGTSLTIVWQSTVQTSVKIEITYNNGSTWTVLEDSVANTGSYPWNPVPNTRSSNCKIRITTLDNKYSDESDAIFSVIENKSKLILLLKPNGGEILVLGDKFDIEWISSKVENVDIDYSINNGESWINIVAQYPADAGTYRWDPIPNVVSSECLVRVRDTSNENVFDKSNSNFVILVESETNLILLTPNGGEEWEAGTQQEIKWFSKAVSKVDLYYSTNNGVDWTSIGMGIANTGIYYWKNIPNTPSTLARIKIVDADNAQQKDESDNTFFIKPEPKLSVTSPAGGEVWLHGSSQTIRWTSENIRDVNIDYSTNNGADWFNIAEVAASVGFYKWDPIPEHNSTLCAIKIYDADDDQPYDISSTFTITNGEDLLELITPNGGESWAIGSVNFIKWQTIGVEKVKIDYTTNNGSNWIPIANNITNTGQYPWPILSDVTPSILSKVRVTDYDNPATTDESNNIFTIYKPDNEITVSLPNGGEEWPIGSKQNIQWNSDGVGKVTIEYTTNSGVNWIEIAENLNNTGMYIWNSVPNTPSLLCKIRVFDTEEPTTLDESNSTFKIYQSEDLIDIIKPNGGESWDAGTVEDIMWASTGVSSVKIEYTTNNGINWLLVANDVTNNGLYSWNIPRTISSLCRVRVSDADDGFPIDESNNTFSIDQEPEVTVVSPNGGEKLLTGSGSTISWTSTNISDIKIELTTNNGASWSTILNSIPSTGTYFWQELPDVNSTLCRIKISDASDGVPFDISDNNFTISNQVIQSIAVTSPNGGEEWEAGTIQNITWQASAIDSVDIYLTTNNGLNWQPLVESLESSGAFQWQVPTNINSPQCKIRISDAKDSEPSDESNQPFTILPIQTIQVTAPTGGEVLLAGQSYTIQWAANGIQNVKIQYTTTNGLGSIEEPAYYTITPSAPNTGSFETSFSIPSAEYYVIISDASDGTPSARSVGNFTVLAQVTPSITVTSPNGGEDWLTSDPQYLSMREIRWTSYYVENVDIEYSLNGGANWKTIATNVPSNGLFNWSVPQTIDFRSDLCLIQISDHMNENITDMSDSYFTLHPQTKLLRLDFPNGDEYWYYTVDDSTGEITLNGASGTVGWTSAGIWKVKLEYTTNNGMSWITIVDSVESTGVTFWNFVGVTPSRLARIRVIDVSNNAGTPPMSDESDSVFNVNIIPLANDNKALKNPPQKKTVKLNGKKK